jgi:hypothetical protein
VVEVRLERSRIDVELSLTDVSLVLKVGIVDAPSILILLNLNALKTKNLDAV